MRTQLICLLVVGLLHSRPGVAQDSAAIRRAHVDSLYTGIAFTDYLDGMVGPRSVVRAVALAGFDQRRGRPVEFSRTWRGFEDRLGSRYGQVAIAHTLRYGAARVFAERDLRYYPCSCGDSASRLFNALVGPFRVTSPRGIHYSILNPVTVLVSGMLVTSVHPGGFHAGDGLRAGATGLIGESLADVVREYWPWRWRPPFL